MRIHKRKSNFGYSKFEMFTTLHCTFLLLGWMAICFVCLFVVVNVLTRNKMINMFINGWWLSHHRGHATNQAMCVPDRVASECPMEHRPTNRVIQVVHHSRTKLLSIQVEHVPSPMMSVIHQDRLVHVPNLKLSVIDRSGRGQQLAMEPIHAIIQDRMVHQDRMERQDRMTSRRFRLEQQCLGQRVRHGQDPMVKHNHQQDLHQERHVSLVSSRCYRWQQPKRHIQINTYKSSTEQKKE